MLMGELLPGEKVAPEAGYRSAHSDDVHEWCAVGLAPEAHA